MKSNANRNINIKRLPDVASVSYDPRDPVEKLRKAQVRRFNSVLDKFPKFRDNLCFADIAIVDKPQHTIYLFFSWADILQKTSAFETYQAFLKELVYEKKRSVLDHIVFQAGLPENVTVAREIDVLLEFPMECAIVDIRDLANKTAISQPLGPALNAQYTMSLKYASVSEDLLADSRCHDENLDVKECFQAYAEGVFSRSSRIGSRNGQPVQRVLLIPLNTWDWENGKPKSVFVGGAFIGLGMDAQDDCYHFVNALKRFVYETIGLGFKMLASEDLGNDQAVEAFGHQVKKLPLGFAGKNPNWLLTQDEFDKLQNELVVARSKAEYRLAPFPELLDGVGELLTFWSFEYDPKSLLIGEMFESLDGVMRYAAELATKSQKARAFTMFPMTTVNAANELASFPQLGVSADEWSKIKLVKELFLGQSGKPELNSENELEWKQFAGLLRLLVVVCEGAIQHCCKTEPPRVDCTLPVGSTLKPLSQNLRLTISNPCRPKENESFSTRVGMKGEKIKQFILDNFLFDLNASIKTTKETDTSYAVEIGLNTEKCSWISTR